MLIQATTDVKFVITSDGRKPLNTYNRDMSQYPTVSTDAEWSQVDLENTSQYITKQATFIDTDHYPVLSVVLWNDLYPLPTDDDVKFAEVEINAILQKALDRLKKKTLNGAPYIKNKPLEHRIIVIPANVQSEGFTDYFKHSKSLNMEMFYSPKDVEGYVKTEKWRELLTAKKSPIDKKRNLTGEFKLDTGETVRIVDWFGAFNNSLDSGLKSVGLDNPYKNIVSDMGHSKGRMDLFYGEHTRLGLVYAVTDSALLHVAGLLKIAQVNDIILEAVNVPGFSIEEFPRSSGALVSKTFERWLEINYPDLFKWVMFMSDSNNNRNWSTVRELKSKLLTGDIEPSDAHKKLRHSGIIHGLGLASIPGYGVRTTNTGLFGAIVQGGRAVCEYPNTNVKDNRIENVFDPDLKSCYGSALARFRFPIGIPHIHELALDDEAPTLGKFLKDNESEFVDDLWFLDVSGTLSFEQDLIHSKYGLDTRTIASKILNMDFDHESENLADVWGREIELAHLGGEFVLTTQQIEHGHITKRTLDIIRSVATPQELKEIMSLKVNAAIVYQKSKYVSHEQYVRDMSSPSKRGGKYQKGDFRYAGWTYVDLSEFIGNFLSTRKKFKALSTGKGSEYDLLQAGVKLFVNTLYGVFAAPYFPIGNTVLANNITANARGDVWMMGKALNTVLTATDGGMASYLKVNYLKKGKKPGFHQLANRSRMLKHRSINTRPLTNKFDFYEVAINAAQGDKDSQELIDTTVLAHVDEFWSAYGLSLNYVIEVKYENTGRVGIYLPTADYLIDETAGVQPDGSNRVVKSRGAKQSDHPKRLFLEYLLNKGWEVGEVPPYPEYTYDEIIGINDWKANPHSVLMPGDAQSKTTYHKPHKLGFLPKTYAEYKRGEDNHSKNVRRYNNRVIESKEKGESVPYFGLSRDIYDQVRKSGNN